MLYCALTYSRAQTWPLVRNHLTLISAMCCKRLFKLANVEYTDFIRTSQPRHQRAVHHLWVGCYFSLCLTSVLYLLYCSHIQVAHFLSSFHRNCWLCVSKDIRYLTSRLFDNLQRLFLGGMA